MRDPDHLMADAEHLLNNPAHREALERIEREVCRRIARSEFNGSEDAERYREKLNLLLYVQNKYRQILVQMISTGQIEAHELDQRRRWKKAGL